MNEASGRYSVMPLQFYTPDVEIIRAQSKANKQGREEALDRKVISQYIDNCNTVRDLATDMYSHALENDIARELARIDLPLSTYTEWYWKMDLHNLMHFLSLRSDSHAQYEIRVYSDLIAGIVKEVAPIAYEAWIDYKYGARTFSRLECKLLEENYRTGNKPTEEYAQSIGLSKREWLEFVEKMSYDGTVSDFVLDITKAKTPEYFKEQAERFVPVIK